MTHFGIYPHAVRRVPNPEGGYVVRPCDSEGAAYDFYHYGGIPAVRVYKLRGAAEACAERLTFGKAERKACP